MITFFDTCIVPSQNGLKKNLFSCREHEYPVPPWSRAKILIFLCQPNVLLWLLFALDFFNYLKYFIIEYLYLREFNYTDAASVNRKIAKTRYQSIIMIISNSNLILPVRLLFPPSSFSFSSSFSSLSPNLLFLSFLTLLTSLFSSSSSFFSFLSFFFSFSFFSSFSFFFFLLFLYQKAQDFHS